MPRNVKRDRWIALGLLLLVIGVAYLVLVHPWFTQPMIAVQDELQALRERELRVRVQLQQAPEVSKRLRQARQTLESRPGFCRRLRPNWPRPAWCSGWSAPWWKPAPATAAARSATARRCSRKARTASPALRCRCACAVARRSWPRCCTAWKTAPAPVRGQSQRDGAALSTLAQRKRQRPGYRLRTGRLSAPGASAAPLNTDAAPAASDAAEAGNAP